MRIEDGRLSFYQWDINQRLIIEDEKIEEVHFSNAITKPALVCDVYVESGVRYANVPNILLQTDWTLKAYGCCDECVRDAESYIVNPREKPADYVYTETEVKTFSALEERIEELEKNGGAGGAVSSVNGKTGDVVLTAADVGAATPTVIVDYYDSLRALIEGNSTAIEDLSTELDNYYTKEETDKAIKDNSSTVDLTGYATEAYVDEKVSGIEIPETDLSNYYTKEETDNAITQALNSLIDGDEVSY